MVAASLPPLLQAAAGGGALLFRQLFDAHAENVTQPLHHGDRVCFGGRFLEVRSTPGHTDGCVSDVLDDQSMAFTGDALLVRGCGRCDFQQGNAHTLWASITEQIFSPIPTVLLFPHPQS